MTSNYCHSVSSVACQLVNFSSIGSVALSQKNVQPHSCPVSRQISAVPDLCCIVTWRLVESVGRVFDSYGHATSLVWMQQSPVVTPEPVIISNCIARDSAG